jgi:uncharacterized protein (DUF58 family)
VTGRGTAVGAVAASLIVWGWRASWPELTALGVVGLALVIAAVLVVGRAPRVEADFGRGVHRVARGEKAAVRIALRVTGQKSWLRLAEGSLTEPRRTIRLPRASLAGPINVNVPLDTTSRGRWPIGPYAVVHGDAWSIVNRVVARVDGGLLIVHPTTHVIKVSLSRSRNIGDTDNASRRAGQEHFHALREYVLGDEPRMIHWRSSARAGQLVVRQNVAAAAHGTAVVLDTDASAYGTGHSMTAARDDRRFEAAVEVVASLVVAHCRGDERVHLFTTAEADPVIVGGSRDRDGFLDVLAGVRAAHASDVVHTTLSARIRSTRCSRVFVVTGTPSAAACSSLQATARAATSLTVVRMSSETRTPIAGVHVIDLTRPEDLAG